MNELSNKCLKAFRSHAGALDGNSSIYDAIGNYYEFLKAAQDMGR
jgi:hypothetical protein